MARLAFACTGLFFGWQNTSNLLGFLAVAVDASLATALMSSMVYIYYAYTGWNAASYLAGEIRDASVILPWAIRGSARQAALLYLLRFVVYALLALLPPRTFV